MKLPITLACGLYDRTFGLRDGSIPVEGVDLNFLPMMPVTMAICVPSRTP